MDRNQQMVRYVRLFPSCFPLLDIEGECAGQIKQMKSKVCGAKFVVLGMG